MIGERAGLKLMVDCPPLSKPVYVGEDHPQPTLQRLQVHPCGKNALTLRQAGNTAQLRIQDTDTGIPAEEMPRLFERFHRV